MLWLGSVAAVFKDDGIRDGVLRDPRVEFGQRPLRDGVCEDYYPDDHFPINHIAWHLAQQFIGGAFVWLSPARTEPCSAADLADEIAKRLAEYHIEYKRACDSIE